ncbi:MarR family winged helix-turn-helix transcriptional regulator [Ascidiimonas sp. W6]|uniref:MarR family winged helix-turn-helix transcriptional regulator n=1 Tax=Ascidiimonas meishanensis TaxID=3128903 RepID=UPI0030EF6A60
MLFNFDVTLLPWVGKINKDFSFLVSQRFSMASIDLTAHQWLLLKKLDEFGEQPQQNLAFITDRDKTSLTRLINIVERKKLVKRVPSKEDKRVNNIHITGEGTKTLKKALPIMQQLIVEMEKGIDPAEIKETIDTLKKVRHNLEELTN